MEIEHKRNILKIIANLAASDGQIEESEVQFLYHVGKSFHLTLEESQAIVADGQSADMEMPKSEQMRMNVLYYLLFMMNADHQVNPQEITFIKKIGFKLGFRSRLVEDMIATIQNEPNAKTTPDKLLANIKRYMN